MDCGKSTLKFNSTLLFEIFRFQELLKLKDTQVEDLRYETARLKKAHDDLLATYEAKLARLGIPAEELGFK